jgi:IBR domain, a half RING-finger domain
MDVGLDEIDIETVILSLRSESCFLGPGAVEVDDDDDDEEETDFCVICDDGVVLEREDFPDCGHGKQFCEDCLSTFITGKITDSAISTLGCPFPGCKQRFPDTFLAAHTTENIFLKYKEVDGEMRKELSRNKYIKSFQNFFGNIYFEAANLFRRVVTDCRRCPSCRYIIEKDGGCNHMTCRKCNHQFNWCCGSDYRRTHNDTLCLIYRRAVPCLSIAPVILLVLYLFLKFYQSVSSFSLPTVIFLCLNTLLSFESTANTANWYWKDTVTIMYLSFLLYSKFTALSV